MTDATIMMEELVCGVDMFKTVSKHLEDNAVQDWLLGKEWEDVLVPVRLPKGMKDLLTIADEEGAKFTADECSKCEKGATCPVLTRNMGELVLTVLLKQAISHASITLQEGR